MPTVELTSRLNTNVSANIPVQMLELTLQQRLCEPVLAIDIPNKLTIGNIYFFLPRLWIK